MKSYAKYSKQEKPNKTAVSIYSSFWRKNRDAWRETQRDGYREVERSRDLHSVKYVWLLLQKFWVIIMVVTRLLFKDGIRLNNLPLR